MPLPAAPFTNLTYGQGLAGEDFHPAPLCTGCALLKYVREDFRCMDLNVLQEGGIYSMSNLTEKQPER